jgi:hypothetical protein
VLDDLLATGDGHEVLLACGPHEPHGALDAIGVLTPHGDETGDADGVVEVDEQIDPGQSGRRQSPLGQRLRRVAGAGRLGAERRVRLPPGRHVRVLVRGAAGQSGGEAAGRVVEQRRTRVGAGAAREVVRLDHYGCESRCEGSHLVGHGERESHLSDLRVR